MCGAIVRGPTEPNSRTEPSLSALATHWWAMLPPAPGLFWTTMVLPMFSLSLVAIMRAAASAAPPGTNPTIRLMGFSGGNVWAWAGADVRRAQADKAAAQE